MNLIDYDNLSVSHPEMVYDLPAGMPRLMQTATGYEKTFVSTVAGTSMPMSMGFPPSDS